MRRHGLIQAVGFALKMQACVLTDTSAGWPQMPVFLTCFLSVGYSNTDCGLPMLWFGDFVEITAMSSVSLIFIQAAALVSIAILIPAHKLVWLVQHIP